MFESSKFYKMDNKKNGHGYFLTDNEVDRDLCDLEETFKNKNFETFYQYKNDYNNIQLLENTIDHGIRAFINNPSNSFFCIISIKTLNESYLEVLQKKFEDISKTQDKLNGVPKIFIINTNRGAKIDKGFKIITTDNLSGQTSVIKDSAIPKTADFIEFFSCSEGYEREIEINFITILNDVIKKNIFETDIYGIFTKVTSMIAQKQLQSNNKQQPVICSRLLYQLYFGKAISINNIDVFSLNSTVSEYKKLNEKIPILFFNQLNFEESLSLDNREIESTDLVDLQDTFKEMSYTNFTTHSDKTKDEIIQELKSASSKAIDGIMIFFSTHGDVDLIYAKDKEIKIDEILSIFEEAKNLMGKPKIIFLIACAGSSTCGDFGNEFKEPFEGRYKENKYEFNNNIENNTNTILPAKADFVIVRSTFKGYVSYKKQRHVLYLTKLNEVLKKHQNKNLNILNLLTIVNEKVAIEFDLIDHTMFSKKQMPCFETTLTKNFFF